MKTTSEHELNQRAYGKLKATIARTYPRGRFVAIHAGKVVADAENFDLLEEELARLKTDPRRTLIVQAGEIVPEKVTIFI